MGQSASKAAQAAKRAATRNSQAIPHQRTRTAAEVDEWKRISAAAAASSTGGLHANSHHSPITTRSEQHEADTVAAIAAAASIEEDVMPEMPPDLIKFLNDAGPLQRTLDKELTSKKVYDSLVKDEHAREEQAKQANSRVRRKMPIMASFGDDATEGDGTMVERTTNFSTTDRSAVPKGLVVTREDLFRLSDKVKGLRVDTPEWKKMMQHEYEGIATNASKTKNFDQLKDMALFQNSLRYIGVPVLMKDTDGDIIGMWRHKSDDMKVSLGLKPIPERSLQFVMLNEGGVANES